MGWKALKECFGIGHIVQVTDQGVCIGSGYVYDLVTINPASGKVRESDVFANFLKNEYPTLFQATAEQVLELLKAPDVFSVSIPVYTYRDGRILEKLCEKQGWPNVTHDGCLMYENRFSTDREQVIRWAKRNAQLGVQYGMEAVLDAEKELARRKAHVADEEAILAQLELEYPGVVIGAEEQ